MEGTVKTEVQTDKASVWRLGVRGTLTANVPGVKEGQQVRAGKARGQQGASWRHLAAEGVVEAREALSLAPPPMGNGDGEPGAEVGTG